ncbi:zf-HC2 domain-containing protein [Dyella psychrodurans]|uniref:Zf-HC2 domain-containing protein n=1 Tax=Dyella psychrodurans TaxID=1927960 RepID=A0A370XEJ0_9GAMM|nr:zf-HC2 domain-containing protein [Dyella psychrodurans]RDS86722.1 zf-HC2 domain-containing protein [Dyella psychrodurans]
MNGRVIKFEGPVHAEADRLLPWLINGTLDDDERRQVEQHVAECAQCQREVAWLRTLQSQYRDDDADADHVPHAMKRLRHRMGKVGIKRATPASLSSAWRRRGRRLAWLAAAQAAIIFAMGVVLLQDRHAAYHTLSAPASKGSLLVVVFDPRISEAQMRRLVRAGDGRIVGGPTETGAYLLSVPDEQAASSRKMLHDSPSVTMVENLQAGGSP